jgi:hypothetical protein
LNQKTPYRLGIAAVASAVLVACGGGGDGPSQDPIAQGVYGGGLTGSTSSSFQMLMLDGGQFWSIYGTQTASAFLVAGFVEGTGTSDGGSFRSTNAKDFGFAPGLTGTINATYNNEAKTINGTFTPSGGTVGFNGGPIPGSLYNYDTPASLSAIAGNWSLTSLNGEGISVSVSSGGAITALSEFGCSFSGTATPRSSGKNVFNVSIQFGAAPCLLPNQSASGVAVVYPLAGGGTQFIFAGTDSSRTYGTVAAGTR